LTAQTEWGDAQPADTLLFQESTMDDNTPLMQWNNSYILFPAEQGIMILHQHRAHTAIIYKELSHQLINQQAYAQPLLFPEVLELSEDDWDTIQLLLLDLQALGFTLEQFSPRAYTILSVPALLGQSNPVMALLQVIHRVQETQGDAQQQWRENMMLSLAEQMAIPKGKSLSDAEKRDLVKRFLSLGHSRFLPNGKIILSYLSHEDIQKRF
jgi:DNA mismatch repair protein MutL